jgi:prepilin-type N-terminal cleavage/methylation domain-containing protein
MTMFRSLGYRRRSKYQRYDLPQDERGVTLVELLVALLIIGIALSMTVVIMATVGTVSSNELRSSHASETATTGLAEIAQWIRGAVSPMQAADAHGSTVEAMSPTPCWGTSDPGPKNGTALSPDAAASLAIVTAAPFDLVYCGYAPGNSGAKKPSSPGVYEITIAPNSCRGTTGYCTLAVYSCGSSFDPGNQSIPSTINYSSPSTCVTKNDVVALLSRIWCNTWCQQGGTTQPPPGSTPPIFSYYPGNSGQETAGGPAPSPLAPPGEPILGLAPGENAVGLSQVQLVVIRVHVLANRNPNLRLGSGANGTVESQQIWLDSQQSSGFEPPAAAGEVLNFQPSEVWFLDGTTNDGSTVPDAVYNDAATINGAISVETSGSPPFDDPSPSPVMYFSGGYLSTSQQLPAPSTFSLVAWFETTSPGGIVSFGNFPTGSSQCYDRHLYVGTNGHLFFGVWPNQVEVIQSPGMVNDGQWHLAVATLSSAGQDLYIDGQLVASSPNTQAQATCNQLPFTGYWRIGELAGGGWPSTSGQMPFSGQIAEVAVYPKALTARQVQSLYQSSGRYNTCGTWQMAAYGPAQLWPLSGQTSLDELSSVPPLAPDVASNLAGNSVDEGEPQGSPPEPASGSGPLPCDPQVAATSFSGGYLSTSQQLLAPSTFSLVAWFKTTSSGGIISFGNFPTGSSQCYDRHLYVGTNGHLVFGIYWYQVEVIQSPNTVNDGQWHLAVATLSSAGQDLYIDGQLVASSPNTQAQATCNQLPFTGYWRIGELAGVPGWPYTSGQMLFSGQLADVAVYPMALTGDQVSELYQESQVP